MWAELKTKALNTQRKTRGERGEKEEEEERQTARVDFAFHCGKFVIAKTEREEEEG